METILKIIIGIAVEFSLCGFIAIGITYLFYKKQDKECWREFWITGEIFK